MVVGRGNDPPHDTGQFVHNQPNQVLGLMVGTGGAENGGLNDQVQGFPENSDERAETHRVDFKVQNLTNPVHFLYDLLMNLQVVDPTSCLVPSDQAPLASLNLSDNSVLRSNDADLQTLSSYYLHDLHATNDSPGFRGCFILRCNIEFLKFKEDRTFMAWLKGNNTPLSVTNKVRISLDKCELPGTKRYPVGFFIHTVAREDLAQNFADMYLKLLIDDEWSDIPLFSVRAYTAYMAENSCRAFRVIAASEEDAKLVSHMMATMMGAPSNKISFIPYQTWRTMKNQADKSAYIISQHRFMTENRATILEGFRDASFEFRKPHSAMTWFFKARSSNNRVLFSSILQVPTKQVVLYYKYADEKDVQAWKLTAFEELVRFANCGREVQSSIAEEMFMDPENIYRLSENSHATIGMIEQNSIYSNFKPIPGEVTPTKRNTRNQQRNLNLVFDSWTPAEEQVQQPRKLAHTSHQAKSNSQDRNTASVGDTARKAALRAANAVISRSQKQDKHKDSLTTTPAAQNTLQVTPAEQRELQIKKNAMKRAAEEASVIAVNEARRIYDEYDETVPPSFNSTGYNYEVILDSYGNELPVVWMPSEQNFLRLTEENYLRSKEEQENEVMDEAGTDTELNGQIRARIKRGQTSGSIPIEMEEAARQKPPPTTMATVNEPTTRQRELRVEEQPRFKDRTQFSTNDVAEELESRNRQRAEVTQAEKRMELKMESKISNLIESFKTEMMLQRSEHERERKDDTERYAAQENRIMEQLRERNEEAISAAAREVQMITAIEELERMVQVPSYTEVVSTKPAIVVPTSMQMESTQQVAKPKPLSSTLAYSRVLAGSSQSQSSSTSERTDGLTTLTRSSAVTRALSPSKTTPAMQKRKKLTSPNQYLAFQSDDAQDNEQGQEQVQDDCIELDDADSSVSVAKSVGSAQVSVVTGISGVSGSYHWDVWEKDSKVEEVNQKVKELDIAKSNTPGAAEDPMRFHNP